MGKILNGISIIALGIIVFWFFKIDYSDLGFKRNLSPYLSIISLCLIIAGMQINRINNSKKNQDQETNNHGVG